MLVVLFVDVGLGAVFASNYLRDGSEISQLIKFTVRWRSGRFFSNL